MRIVIDMQGAQTESRYRGIGRYTLAFTKAVVRNRGDNVIYLVLNGLLHQTIEPIKAMFEGLLPLENIKVWQAPGPVSAMDPANADRRNVAELIREAFIEQLQPDIIHITSLFEGFEDDAVVSLRKIDQKSWISVSFYDLIPYLNPNQYLTPNPLYEKYYIEKIHQLKKVDVGLAISMYAAQEGQSSLTELKGKLFNVSTAVDDQFKSINISSKKIQILLEKFKLNRPFVMYTGGPDERKNLSRLLQAYAKLESGDRQENQLLLAGKFAQSAIREFQRQAIELGLEARELRFTGYIDDEELIALYNLCRVFVFPSWQEGFGLPVLEALSCGAVVIGSNTSSLPEVIGLDTAMFDPFNVDAITEKLKQALHDEAFRSEVRKHGEIQSKKFSWDGVADQALHVWESTSNAMRITAQMRSKKPRLAYVSPLPPERTGIADYSAVLLPALSEHYDIELIVRQEHIDTELISSAITVRDVSWFKENSELYDRVLYQIGNSPYHQHMLSLVQEIPGVVILHDFFLSGLLSWLEHHGEQPLVWQQALVEDHGYVALQTHARDPHEARLKYPVCGQVLRHAQALIVHSHHAKQLLAKSYGNARAKQVHVIPLLRKAPTHMSVQEARYKLGFAAEDFVVCSFGFLDASKQNLELLNAWLKSSLSKDHRCKLIFVGQNAGGDYGEKMIANIDISGRTNQIQITGFVTALQYRQYLATADLAVQLRIHSRGETSAAALDVLNHGIPTIVNAHGSMAELEASGAWMLPDEWGEGALVEALETIWISPQKRQAMHHMGQTYCQTKHSPKASAAAYTQVIEENFGNHQIPQRQLIAAIARNLPVDTQDNELQKLAQSLANNFPIKSTCKHLYLDITATSRYDLKTGIERVTRAITVALLNHSPDGYVITPIYLDSRGGEPHYRHAHRYTLGLMNCPDSGLEESPVSPHCGDIILVLDLSGNDFVQAQKSGLHRRFQQQGVAIHALIYDLLPVRMPQVFPPGADKSHAEWLHAISTLDGAIAISKAVMDDFVIWQTENLLHEMPRRPFIHNWFHLGSDLSASAPTLGVPQTAQSLLGELKKTHTFLMVGTIEPRKAHIQVLEAFTLLWSQGHHIHLVIVGQEGWKGLDDAQRRDIPEVVSRLNSHPENKRHLHWLKGISDEYLEKIYEASACLIAASWGEGFGLPLVEAANHQLPVLARDIPVFREVAGLNATYFTAKSAPELSNAVQAWVKQRATKQVTDQAITQLTWKQSVQQLCSSILVQSEQE